jgi:phosphate transport system permease protein
VSSVPTTLSGGPVAPARRIVVSTARTTRRLLLDRWTSRLVVVGGLVIIASILAIVAVIVLEIAPLFRPARATALPAASVAPDTIAAGVDEYREVLHTVVPGGTLRIGPLRGGATAEVPIATLGDTRITAATTTTGGRHLLGTADGRVALVDVRHDVRFVDGQRTVVPQPDFADATVVDAEARRPVVRVAGATPESGPIIVAQVGPTALLLLAVAERKALVGPATTQEIRQAIAVPIDGEITALAVDGRGDDLFVGTSRGAILRYDLRDRGSVPSPDVIEAGVAGAAVSALGFLNGDRTLVVGDARGGVSTWQLVPAPGRSVRLARMHQVTRHESPVTAISPSRRDKSFATGDQAGGVAIHYATSGRTLLTLRQHGSAVRALVFAPKADGIVATHASGAVSHWHLDNPHAEATWRTLFGKVWYEGYAQPEYVWQSTGGTDDFEAKLSLTPLIYGTLKGTFYALLFAVPVALLAALYVSEFMHPTLRAWVKPAVEIMAALPSVVLGFFAGLWLAPAIERIVPGLAIFPVVLAVAILALLGAWQRLPVALRARRPGMEAFLLAPIAAVAGWIAFSAGAFIESWLLGGDYRTWLHQTIGLGYDQRNSVVVGIAMGFAVIPIIFTIADDSLSNVPQHLRAGSRALGANRWQTAVRVVLPTASPGIFSAVMIGFGRAVGETMIVLMATGNTPVMDWNIFSGFRALSANIAVELPEAPEGGTLFRVLFLAAFLLFCFTFVVNTVAELVRVRLRRRYQGL